MLGLVPVQDHINKLGAIGTPPTRGAEQDGSVERKSAARLTTEAAASQGADADGSGLPSETDGVTSHTTGVSPATWP